MKSYEEGTPAVLAQRSAERLDRQAAPACGHWAPLRSPSTPRPCAHVLRSPACHLARRTLCHTPTSPGLASQIGVPAWRRLYSHPLATVAFY